LGAYFLTNGIEFSDAYDYLKKRTNVNELYLFGDEIHFSEKGHAAMAGFLSE
jgi:lysophospholipase L1-like esterase